MPKSKCWAVTGVAALNPAISEHVIMPCLTMLLHTATASPASPLPAAPTAGASAAGGSLRGGTTSSRIGTGSNAGTTTAGGTSASRQRAAASPSQTQQSAAGLAGTSMSMCLSGMQYTCDCHVRSVALLASATDEEHSVARVRITVDYNHD